MSLDAWLALTLAYVLGAVSPGPSLAIVLRNTVAGGRMQGVVTGFGHGLGFGLYALAAATGIAAALAAAPAATRLLETGGIVLLAWLAFNFLRSARRASSSSADEAAANGERASPSRRSAFAHGFAVAIFNPKILAWMLAVFAPFVQQGTPTPTLLGMAALGMVIDGLWYMSAATLLGQSRPLAWLRRAARGIDAAMGILMLVLAVVLALRAYG